MRNVGPWTEARHTVAGGNAMNQDKKKRGNNPPNEGNQQGFDERRAEESGSQPNRERSSADDQGLRRKPLDEPATPDDGDTDRPGAEPRQHTEATMPPGEGQTPKRRHNVMAGCRLLVVRQQPVSTIQSLSIRPNVRWHRLGTERWCHEWVTSHGAHGMD